LIRVWRDVFLHHADVHLVIVADRLGEFLIGLVFIKWNFLKFHDQIAFSLQNAIFDRISRVIFGKIFFEIYLRGQLRRVALRKLHSG